jgi:hypothetical protein
MDQIKTIIIIILSALLLRCCVKDEVVKEVKSVEYIQGKTDTIYITHTVTKRDILPSKVLIVYDTINNQIVQLKEYTTEYKDSLVNIEIKQMVDGILLKSDITYTANFPSYHTVDTLKITNVIDKSGLYIGTQFGYRNITPYASYLHKSYKFDLGFNFFNRTPMVGIGVKL